MALRDRTIVYVDGFNLYYRALRGTPYKWLDLHALCDRLLPHNDIRLIRYYTARVSDSPEDPAVSRRQAAYLRALDTCAILSIQYGTFLRSRQRMPLATPASDGSTHARVIRMEEKGSDVNLATDMLLDAYNGRFDVAVVISNDSDLVSPIRAVVETFGRRVGVVSPSATTTRPLREAATFVRRILPKHLRAAQFPDAVPDRDGFVTKPASWL